MSVGKLDTDNIIDAYFCIRSIASFSKKHNSVDCTFKSVVSLWYNSIEKIIGISWKETDFHFWLLAEHSLEPADQLTASMTEGSACCFVPLKGS